MDTAPSRVYLACCLAAYVTASVALGGQSGSRNDRHADLPKLSSSELITGVETGRLTGEGEVKWVWTYFHGTSTRFLRFHLVGTELVGDSWYVSVFDRAEGGAEVDRITAGDFRTGPMERGVHSVWTKRIDGANARLELHGRGPLGNLSLRVVRCNFEAGRPAPKAIIGEDQREDLVKAYGRGSAFYRWSIPIAYITFQTTESQDETNCTGFLVASTLLLTNNHCIAARSQLRTAKAEFYYESDSLTPRIGVDITDIVDTSESLDYSLLRIKQPGVSEAVSFERGGVRHGQPLVLIQHPNGQPKMIALKGCQVDIVSISGLKTGSRTDFTHVCDSEGGSSGSPLIDETSGKVVGLHHMAALNPRRFEYENFGVAIDRVLRSIERRCPSAYAEIVGAK